MNLPRTCVHVLDKAALCHVSVNVTLQCSVCLTARGQNEAFEVFAVSQLLMIQRSSTNVLSEKEEVFTSLVLIPAAAR